MQRTYTWDRPNERVRLRGFTKEQVEMMQPAFSSTDRYLKSNKQLNAQFVLQKQPKVFGHTNPRVAAETKYRAYGGRAKVVVNPAIFDPNTAWNPAGVASHEIGHLIGPVRGTTAKERYSFQKNFSYRQKKVYHELAPQQWEKRRNNPLKGAHTRQAVNPAEDFAETWRHLTGEPLTNRTSSYFDVQVNSKRLNHMNKYVMN